MAFTTRYVRADAAGSGDGTTNTNSGANGAFTLAEAITHSASNTSQDYNVKAGTYTNTTTTRTFNGVGLTTGPNRWRGFKTTPGDMDGRTVSHGTFASGTEIPFFSFTTGKVTISGAHQIFMNIDVRGASVTGQLSLTGANTKRIRCRTENTNAAAASVAVDNSANNNQDIQCWYKATSTATRIVNITSGHLSMIHPVFEGGGHGIDCAASAYVRKGIFRDVAGHGMRALAGTGAFFSIASTFYSPGSACIRLDAMPTVPWFEDNIFAAYGTYGIDNNSGANTNLALRRGNTYWNSGGSGTDLNFGDSPSLDEITLSADPFIDAANGDFRLNANAARAVQLNFQNNLTVDYSDKGAAQHLDSGVATARARAAMLGGMRQR